jgi:hypothetical protein
MKSKTRNIIVAITLTLGITAEAGAYQYFYGNDTILKADENPKVEVVEKIQQVDAQIDELHKEEVITQENWIKEGDLLLEKEELEKELDREGYYKKHLMEDIEMGRSMLKDIQLYNIESPDSTETQIQEGKERIERFGALFDEYEKKSETCDNYEELYNNLTKETNDISVEIREKYKQ